MVFPLPLIVALGLVAQAGEVKLAPPIRLATDVSAVPEAQRGTAIDRCAAVLRSRVAMAGVKDATVDVKDGTIELASPLASAGAVDAMLPLLLRPAKLEFFRVAESAAGVVDVEVETKRLAAALEAHPGEDGLSAAELRALDVEAARGRRFFWAPFRKDSDHRDRRSASAYALLEDDPEHRFGGADLAEAYPSAGALNQPAIGFEMEEERATAFGRFTEESEGRKLAIVVDGEIQTAPMLRGRIDGKGIIEGGAQGFTQEEMRLLIVAFNTGEMPLPLKRLPGAK